MIDLIKENISLKNKCYYKTGGNALFYAEPRSSIELDFAINFAKNNNLEYKIIGAGANLLISDNGYNGLIISMREFAKYISYKKDNIITCGAGVSLSDLVNYSISKGLKGLENLAGIPGSVGGAVIMNAGAFGSEIKDIVTNIYTIDSNGTNKIISNKEADFSYRKSTGLNNLIVKEAEFYLQKADTKDLEIIKNDILKRRREKQPLDKPSCGSVFKRPKVGYAGQYIENCNLKGFSIGGAKISEKHANFILNYDNATSTDIKNIINKVKSDVKEKFNVELETEVIFIGQF